MNFFTSGVTALLPRNRLSFRLMLSITLITITVMSFSFFLNINQQRLRAEKELREKARTITKQFLAIRTFIAESQDTTEISRQQAQEYKHLDPVAVEKGIADIFGKETRVTFKEIWLGASKPQNMPDAFEVNLVKKFAATPQTKDLWGVDIKEGQRTFRYMVPIYMEESCLNCHGGEPGGQQIGGFSRVGHKLGDFVGAISINIPMNVFEANLRTDMLIYLTFTIVLILLSITSTYVLMSRLVTNPLGKLTSMATEIGRGNLNFRMGDFKASGEIGVLTTEFKSMAAKLKDLYQGLEDKVAVRTQQLTTANALLSAQQEELKKINQELSKANRLKSEFLASMSHELRTPLTSIIAFTELLLERVPGEINEVQAEYLNDISESSHQLLDSINDLLDFAKIEAGRMELYLKEFNAGDVVAEVEHETMPLALKKGLDLSWEVQEDLPNVVADRRKVNQILLNLVSNAIKFTPRGGRVKIAASYQPEASEITITVKDTGIGIAKPDQELIFEKFRQVDGSSTREHRGTGLGLALVKHLVEMHHGKLWVKSDLGKGSLFGFTIPLRAYNGQQQRQEETSEVTDNGSEKDSRCG